MNRWLRGASWARAGLSACTLMFEVLVVPAALLVAPSYRLLVALSALLMHVGIGLAQSALIGLAFLPNLAAYAFGFSAGGPVPGEGIAWFLAVALAVRIRLSCAVRFCGKHGHCTRSIAKCFALILKV